MMQANASGKLRLRLACVGLILLTPAFTQGAQPVKAQAAKTVTKAASIDDNATWFLAGREGDCAPLTMLQNKVVEFKEVKSPYQLSEKLKSMGHKPEIKEFKAGIRPAVEVRAPSAGIHVMFIKQENCDKKPAAEKK